VLLRHFVGFCHACFWHILLSRVCKIDLNSLIVTKVFRNNRSSLTSRLQSCFSHLRQFWLPWSNSMLRTLKSREVALSLSRETICNSRSFPACLALQKYFVDLTHWFRYNWLVKNSFKIYFIQLQGANEISFQAQRTILMDTTMLKKVIKNKITRNSTLFSWANLVKKALQICHLSRSLIFHV